LDSRRHLNRAAELHLSVSVRSFRAESLPDFIGAVLDGQAQLATAIMDRLGDYPLVVTRDLNEARNWLRAKARGTERYGLVASSSALRLKAVGIHVSADIDPIQWFLAPPDDVRSSNALEDVGTEFKVQGLELDWVGVCWDANLRRENGNWTYWRFWGTCWQTMHDTSRVNFLRNAYRVLLTRARQGMVIFVPYGSEIDKTRAPEFYDQTFDFLQECGVSTLNSGATEPS
jgi:hypothetical protein